jgi:hypothetical protein
MGYPMIDKFLRAILFGSPQRAWYRVPMAWDDANWHIIVKPPRKYSVVIQDVEFYCSGDETLVLAYQLGGVFYEMDRVQAQHESGKRTYVQTLILPKNAEFVVRRLGTKAIANFSCRGYFIKPVQGAGPTRVSETYGTYTYGIA